MPRGVKVRELHLGEGEAAEGDAIVTIRYEDTLRRGERFGGGTQSIDLGRRAGPARIAVRPG
jgi:FKBP-type peptidyl-prolyl cis-trans isomerase